MQTPQLAIIFRAPPIHSGAKIATCGRPSDFRRPVAPSCVRQLVCLFSWAGFGVLCCVVLCATCNGRAIVASVWVGVQYVVAPARDRARSAIVFALEAGARRWERLEIACGHLWMAGQRFTCPAGEPDQLPGRLAGREMRAQRADSLPLLAGGRPGQLAPRQGCREARKTRPTL